MNLGDYQIRDKESFAYAKEIAKPFGGVDRVIAWCKTEMQNDWRMWSFETAEEYVEWYDLLDDEDKRQAEVLQRIIIQESMEEMLSEISNQYTDIRAYLKKFML